MARPAVWFAAISLPREGQHLVRGRSSVKTSPIAREAFEDIEVRTLPADTRIEVPAIAADLALVDPRIAGRTGMVVGESTEVVWVSRGAPFLGAGQVLHWVLLDGDSAPITVSGLSMVRNDRAALLATECVERLPFALRDCGAGTSRTQADPRVREGHNEIRARSWPPGRRVAVFNSGASRSLRVRREGGMTGPVQVRWSANDGDTSSPRRCCIGCVSTMRPRLVGVGSPGGRCAGQSGRGAAPFEKML